MRIAEIYESIQGEGKLTGTNSTFVRVSGCNLRCCFCDTPYASWQPEGDDFSVAEILQRVNRYSANHVVLTGGEPMLFSELVPLTQQLHLQQYHITVETAGTLYLPVTCDLMSISPKLSNSSPSAAESIRWHARHEQTRYAPDVIRNLVERYAYQFKFVIARRSDVAEVIHYLGRHRYLASEHVQLMPEGTNSDDLRRIESWLEPLCREKGLVYCPRRQIEWFGAVRGT